MNIVERAKAPTPKFFKILRSIGLVLLGISGSIVAAPVLLPAAVVTVAGYVAVAGGVISAISQITVDDKAKKEIENLPEGELQGKLATLPKVVGLDSTINEDGDTLIDLVINENADKPDAGFSTDDMLKKKLSDIMSVLDSREKVIVEDYFGISGSPRTLEEIGQDFNLTKERVRQIKEKALRKLRNESSVLFDYL